MISQYGTDAIAGVGLGLMWVNITAQSLFVGTQFGLGALSAQACGARNYRRVGLLLQRQLLMNWMLCVPISICWFWTEEILLSLGQPPRVSQFAGDFVRWQLPGLPFMPGAMRLFPTFTPLCVASLLLFSLAAFSSHSLPVKPPVWMGLMTFLRSQGLVRSIVKTDDFVPQMTVLY